MIFGSDLTGRGSRTVNPQMIGSSPILPANLVVDVFVA